MARKTKSQQKAIRIPQGPAAIFLLNAIGLLFTAFGYAALPLLTADAKVYTPWEIIQEIIIGISMLVFSVILFKKKFDNTLIFASVFLLATSVITLDSITALNIAHVLFYVLLTLFTYIMIKQPQIQLREKVAKLRIILPLYELVLLILSTIQTSKLLFESLSDKMGNDMSEALSRATVIVPSLISLPIGMLIVVAYAMLVNWLADPYAKNNTSKKPKK